MNFDDYYMYMHLGLTPPSSEETEEPEEEQESTSSPPSTGGWSLPPPPVPPSTSPYIGGSSLPPPPPPPSTSTSTSPYTGGWSLPPPPPPPSTSTSTSPYTGGWSLPPPPVSPPSSQSGHSRPDISQTERPLDDSDSYPVHPGTIVDDLQDLRPEYNDDLSQTYEEAYKNENDIYFQLYLSQSTVRRNDFAESGLDDESDERAEEQVRRRVERVRRETMTDLADDRWESIVAIDTKTGEKVFWRYGSRNYTFLQEEQRKMVEGREIALIHNHPNDTAASQADLEGAFWLGAKSLTVVTPSGYRYVYIRGTHEMELAAVINDPNYVANPSWREDVESSTAFWTQTLAEKGNQPEWVMEQEEQVVIDIEDGTPIYLPPLKDVPLGVSQTLAEHLWNNVVLEGREGVPINQAQVLYMMSKWQEFSHTATAGGRAAAYDLRDQILEATNGIQSGIEFFHEAGNVNHVMSQGGEYGGNMLYVNILKLLHDPVNFHAVNEQLRDIGTVLFEQNDRILAKILEMDGRLPSPYVNTIEDMDSPTAITVDTAIDWDIHMVWQEQGKVEELIGKPSVSASTLDMISNLMTIEAPPGADADSHRASEAIGWAKKAVGSSLSFTVFEHRVAIGIAMMFRAHEYSEDDFKAYYDEMIKWVNRQAGQDKFRLPKVGEVLPQYD